ncbi:hypothetical protein DCAR_0934130 [Daucus carota subsp. sativus]|uniref:Uncharacterized protein n=1 Tax=Daucus carota subsp. sativus TaxID=79200 RepID=A0AAF0XUW2_DAUCS|nr:hypothetical protein DCAR_0934130 [Daucus carota subsp. sativus]
MKSRALNKMEPWSNLKGKVVMVTGASSGLGRELCIDLANAGCKIMALELGKHNIRVNSISPGLFPSEITETLMKKEWLKDVCARTVPYFH